LSADLACVDPANVRNVWPLARHLIKAAIDRTNLSSFQDIEDAVLSGKHLLWLAGDGQIEAAATTHLANNVCTLVACGGHDRERWLPLFARIEQYAKDEGCRCMRIYGRKGWERVLPGYKVEHVILERPL
jgi:hypothetical protein